MKINFRSTTVAVILAVLVTALFTGAATYSLMQSTQGTDGPATAHEVKIGMLTSLPIAGAWNTAQKNGLEALAKQYPGLTYVIQSEVAVEDIPSVAENMISEGADIIVVNDEFDGSMIMKAGLPEKYPEKYFGYVLVGDFTRGRNLIRYQIKMYQTVFLAGMIAGAITKTNHLGVVGGPEVPDISIQSNAFLLGARAINPDVIVHVRFVGAWYDPPKESELARLLVIDKNCDVLMPIVDSASVAEVAADMNVWAIGRDIDWVANDWGTEENVLTSFTYHWEVAFDGIVRDYLAGKKYPTNIHTPGMETSMLTESGAVRPTELEQDGRIGMDAISSVARSQISQEEYNMISTTRERMIQGIWDPFMLEIVAGGVGVYKAGEVVSPMGVGVPFESLVTKYYFIEGIDAVS